MILLLWSFKLYWNGFKILLLQSFTVNYRRKIVSLTICRYIIILCTCIDVLHSNGLRIKYPTTTLCSVHKLPNFLIAQKSHFADFNNIVVYSSSIIGFVSLNSEESYCSISIPLFSSCTHNDQMLSCNMYFM